METLAAGRRYDENQEYSIELILFDIDNTLVGDGARQLPSERFRKATTDAVGKIAVGLMTARPLSKAEHILDCLDATDGVSILCNGAQIIANHDRSVLAEWAINPQTCADVLKHVKKQGIEHWVNDDGVDYFQDHSATDSYTRLSDIWDKNSERIAVPGFKPTKPFAIVLHNITSEQAADMGTFVQNHNDNELAVLTAHERQLPDGNMSYDLFIAHPLANKESALCEVARIQKITVDQIMVVDDGRNGEKVVGTAGVGVAMGNAAKETLAAATHVAPSQTEDGAAIALEYALAHFVSSPR